MKSGSSSPRNSASSDRSNLAAINRKVLLASSSVRRGWDTSEESDEEPSPDKDNISPDKKEDQSSSSDPGITQEPEPNEALQTPGSPDRGKEESEQQPSSSATGITEEPEPNVATPPGSSDQSTSPSKQPKSEITEEPDPVQPPPRSSDPSTSAGKQPQSEITEEPDPVQRPRRSYDPSISAGKRPQFEITEDPDPFQPPPGSSDSSTWASKRPQFEVTQEPEPPPRPSILPVPVPDVVTSTDRSTRATFPVRRLWITIVFIVHLAVIYIFNAFEIYRGFHGNHRNQPPIQKIWFPPILTGIGAAGISSFAWLLFSFRHRELILKVALYLSPPMSCLVGAMFIYMMSIPGLVLGSIMIAFGISQAAYVYWVRADIGYSTSEIVRATDYVPHNTLWLMSLTILAAAANACILVAGIGGATALGAIPEMVLIHVLDLLSLTWTMHVIKNWLQVVVGWLKFIHFALLHPFPLDTAVFQVFTKRMGGITFGSIFTPLAELFRGFVQVYKMVTFGSHDGNFPKFKLKRVQIWFDKAEMGAKFVDRWGLVRSGINDVDFLVASPYLWHLFKAAHMEPVIRTELMAEFSFFCGLTGGAVAALAAGAFSLVIHGNYAIPHSIYAFFIGYYTCQIAAAWPLASVAADYCCCITVAIQREPNKILSDRIVELAGRRENADPFVKTEEDSFKKHRVQSLCF